MLLPSIIIMALTSTNKSCNLFEKYFWLMPYFVVLLLSLWHCISLVCSKSSYLDVCVFHFYSAMSIDSDVGGCWHIRSLMPIIILLSTYFGLFIQNNVIWIYSSRNNNHLKTLNAQLFSVRKKTRCFLFRVWARH